MRLLVDEIICRHGVPGQLESNGGPNLLSKLMEEVCGLMGMVNTVSYHPPAACPGFGTGGHRRVLDGLHAKCA